jgi:hypothetical protein
MQHFFSTTFFQMAVDKLNLCALPVNKPDLWEGSKRGEVLAGAATFLKWKVLCLAKYLLCAF